MAATAPKFNWSYVPSVYQIRIHRQTAGKRASDECQCFSSRSQKNPARWVNRAHVEQCSQLDRSDATLTSERNRKVLVFASERKVQNHVLKHTETKISGGVQMFEHSGIKLALLTVPVTLITGQLGINSNVLQNVSRKNGPVITNI